jgi:YidC/Oxa1 family membrane protein insertase
MIDRNFLLGLIASLALLLSYNFYYEWRYGDFVKKQQEQAALTGEKNKKNKPPIKDNEAAGQTAAAVSPTAQIPTPVQAEKTEQATFEAKPHASSIPVESAEAVAVPPNISQATENTVRIKTGVTEVVLSNRGAVPVSYLLEKYRSESGHNVNLRFDFEASQAKLANAGKPLSTVKAYPLLGLKFPKESFSDKVNQAYFTTDAKGGDVFLKPGDAPYSVTYQFTDESGVKVLKKYTFHPNAYTFDLSVLVKADPKWGAFEYSLVWFGLGDAEDKAVGASSYMGPAILVDKNKIADPPTEKEPRKKYVGEIPWAAHVNRFYAAIIMPGVAGNQTVSTQFINESNTAIEWALKARQDDKAETFNLFVGPKQHVLLSKYANGVYSLIDYGWFDIIAKPLFQVLSWFHDYVGNWGWAIIMLTMLMKLIFFPLSQKSFKSMQKLQKIQPHMKRIQEAYKDDKEKLNSEMFRLYKEHKVNPLGGCLPMIIQIPIFFALYKVLLDSIELKGAGWILWIKDLTQHDPYYVTPIIMGATMVIQQMMTPKTGDALQRKMMMAMPVVFTFMFLTFPSGLVIYWLVNNTLTIIQQWLIYREAGKEAN